MDFLIVLLSMNGYYFLFLKRTGMFSPILLTLISFYLVVWTARMLRKYEVIMLTIITLFLAGDLFLIQAITDFEIDTIASPTGKEKLMIEHRNVTLGETSHFYNFYYQTIVPGVIKKLNNDTLTIIRHERNLLLDDLHVLGVEHKESVSVFIQAVPIH